MGRSAQAYGAKAKISLFAILVCLAGCSSSNLEPSFTTVVVNSDPGEDLPLNLRSPCGVMILQEPVINVTGHFSEQVKRGSSAYLFFAPKASKEAALKTVRKCPPIKKAVVGKDGRFTFPYYPVGNYIVLAQTQIFKHAVGSPQVVGESDSPLEVKVLSQAIEEEFTITVFSIGPVTDGQG